ncbi:MAG: porin [Nitrospinae bacterium]|nr:porin [Nitrospinota bacterium]
MRKPILLITGIFTVFFAVNTKYAGAQDALEWFREIQANGFVSSAYTYNFNRPSDSKNHIRIFDTDDNSFKPDVAELVFQKQTADPGSVGFRFDLNYGYSVPSVIHSAGMAQSNDFDLQQGYVSYNAPVGNGLQLDFGKFITHMGLEVIEGYDGWNYNYSRSILFGYAIPFTHTGIRASYNFNDVFSAMLMVVNGWDNVVDNNDSKTLCFHLGIAPWKEVSLSLNYVGGPEQDNNDRNWRHGVNAVLIIKPAERWELQLNGDYGNEEMGPGNGNVEWGGFEGVVRYALTDFLAVNLRGEYFDDGDGARTGTSQELWEMTLTPEITISEHLILRPEYRHDESSVGFFDDHGRAGKSQDTIALNAIFHF